MELEELDPASMLNLSDAADYIGVTLVTLRKKVADGKLPFHSDLVDYRQKLIRVADLNEILISRGINPAQALAMLRQKQAARKLKRKRTH